MTTTTYSVSLDLDSDKIAELIAGGQFTPSELADAIDGAELVEDCLVLEPGTYHADDGNAEMEYECDCGKDAAQEYVDGGDWGSSSKTSWIEVRTWRNGIDGDGEVHAVDKEHHTIAVDPEVPDCLDGHDHRWKAPHSLVGGCKENPGVHGHGGGVTIHEVCTICGCGRVTDTWAQNPSNGEQGLTSVEYRDGEFVDEVQSRHIARAVKALDAKHYDGVPYDLVFVRGSNDADSEGETFYGVDRDDDDLRDYGIALLLDDSAEAPESLGTILNDEECEVVCE